MSTVPVFAVVGRVNKGKSSVVATLAEDESVRIGPEARTTVECRSYAVDVDGERLFELIDTPGFNQAPRALAWMQAHSESAPTRPDAVVAFVRAHENGSEFVDECRLLRPILDGAAILYVVDGTKPYRTNYEAEMEILKWTGRPSIALVNRIGSGDHAAEWRRALEQYFRIVRDFDAHSATFGERLRLLRAFSELYDPWEAPLKRVVSALEAQRADRRYEGATLVTDLLIDAVTFRLSEELDPSQLELVRVKRELAGRFHRELERREQVMRARLKRLYGHDRMAWEEEGLGDPELDAPDFARDLFSRIAWERMGLNPVQLLAAHVGVCAATGAAFDLSVGEVSLGTGMAIGGVIGGFTGVAHLRQRHASVSELTKGVLSSFRRTDKTRRLRIGPHPNPNFRWVVFDRALFYFIAVLDYSHARSDVLHLDGAHGRGLVAELAAEDRRALGKLLGKVEKRGDDVPRELRDQLHTRVLGLLERCEARLERPVGTSASPAGTAES